MRWNDPRYREVWNDVTNTIEYWRIGHSSGSCRETCQWLRDQFGEPGYRSGGVWTHYGYSNAMYSFKHEEHYSWFALRWS